MTEEMALRIRRLRRERQFTYAKIAEEVGVSASSAYYVCNREKRKVVTPVGVRRTVYVTDARWGWLQAEAERLGMSLSQALGWVLDAAMRQEAPA